MSLAVCADLWLTQVLARPAYRLEVTDEALTGSGAVGDVLATLEEPNLFVFAKISTGWPGSIAALERHGFFVVETSLSFERSGSRAGPQTDPRITVRSARPGDRAQVTAIARRSFMYSRFHTDPVIGRGRADDVKASWAANFFMGGRGDAMVVATAGEEVIGFLLLLERDPRLVVDLIAVDAAWRGRMVAQAMLAHAEKLLAHNTVRATTQACNVASVRLWETFGFTLRDSSQVLHFHGGVL